MVSILIPTYNYEVRQLVSAVHNQAVSGGIDFEILVWDDASTNLTIVSENKKITDLPNCHYFKNKTNLGRTKTRRLLAEQALFENLLFLDADVFPKNEDFINCYVEAIQQGFDIVYGGIVYSKTPPEKNKMLRWKYGRKRESLTVGERKKHPFNIISQNILIKRTSFLNLNQNVTNFYGLDILFSYAIKESGIKVVHINNPVFHLGLEDNNLFLKKSLQAVKTTYLLEEKGLLETDFRPLQKSYLTIKRYKLTGVFVFFISLFKTQIERNLVSKNPNLFLFDLYRLHYFAQLKTNGNV